MVLKLAKTTKILILAYVLLALSAIGAGVYLVKQRTNVKPEAVYQTPELMILPERQTLPPNTTFRVMLDAHSYRIGYVHVVISYDKSKIQLNGEVRTSNKLKRVVKKSSNSQSVTTGEIEIVLALAPEDKDSPPSGLFEIAELPIKVVTNAKNIKTQININQQKTSIINMQSQVLDFEAKGAFLTINPYTPPTMTPSPTPIVTIAPRPTPETGARCSDDSDDKCVGKSTREECGANRICKKDENIKGKDGRYICECRGVQ